MDKRTRVNHQIQAPSVRVIDEDGTQLGILPISEALKIASERELDLVEISPNAQPPVCKLIDFDKFRYQQKKAAQLQKKKAKKIEVKTVRLSVRIGQHDLQTKARQTDGFLAEGNLVKIELRMRGREQAHADLAEKQIKNFLGMLSAPFRVEQPAKKTGNTFSTTIAPTK